MRATSSLDRSPRWYNYFLIDFGGNIGERMKSQVGAVPGRHQGQPQTWGCGGLGTPVPTPPSSIGAVEDEDLG